MSLKAKFAKNIQALVDVQSEKILDGQCPDMQTYTRACGIIYGLRMAVQEFGELLETINEEEGTPE